jgi:hypothetical protein
MEIRSHVYGSRESQTTGRKVTGAKQFLGRALGNHWSCDLLANETPFRRPDGGADLCGPVFRVFV